MTTTRGRAYKVCSQFLSFSLYLLTNLALLPPHLTALRAWLPMPMETTTAAAAAGDANEDAEDDNQLQLPTMPHCHTTHRESEYPSGGVYTVRLPFLLFFISFTHILYIIQLLQTQ